MIDILYYIALILLILIVILITVYVTKVNLNGYMTCQKLREIENSQDLSKQLNNVYDFKTFNEFEKMFNKSSIATEYESINNNI